MSQLFTRLIAEAEDRVSTAILLREANRNARRWQTYAARVAFSATLFTVLLTLVWLAVSGLVSTANLGWLGRGLFIAFTVGQLGLAMLVAPLMTSQAFIEEIDDKTLETLILTRLRPRQILAGKLVSRILLLLMIVLGALPVMTLVVGLGGVSAFEVIAVTVHTLLTVVISGSLGAFSALITRSPLLAVFTSATYIVLAYSLPAVFFVMTVGDIDAAVYLSPFMGPTAVGWSALLPALAFAPSVHLIVSLASSLFSLKMRSAREKHTFSAELWQPMHRLIEGGILALLAVSVLPVATVVSWTVQQSSGPPGVIGTVFGGIATVALWLWLAGALHLLTWIFLRLAVEILATIETLLHGGRRIHVNTPVKVWRNPVAWRETRLRRWTANTLPILFTWSLLILAIFQLSWTWLVPGALLTTGLTTVSGAVVLTIWLSTHSIESDVRDNTLDVLLCTTLSSGRILGGKLVGVAAATLPLIVLAAPFLVLGYPQAILLDAAGTGPWDYAVAAGHGLGAWIWSLMLWSLASVAGIALSLRTRQNAFGATCGLIFGIAGVSALSGRFFPEAAWIAIPARIAAPPLAGGASAWQLALSISMLAILTVSLFIKASKGIRGGSAAVAVVLLVLPMSASGQQTILQDDYALAVTPLADGLVRPNTWTAVHLPIENHGGQATGQLQLMDRHGGGLQAWTRPVELPEGSRKGVQLLYKTSTHTRERKVTLDAPGRHAEATFKLQPQEEQAVTIGVIGLDPLGLPGLGDTWHQGVPGPRPRAVSTTTHEDPPQARAVRAGVLPLETLPTHSAALGSLDWIVWPQADPSLLEARQVEALTHWIADGGHLFLTVTDTWRQVADSPLGPALPVTLDGLEDGSVAPLLDMLGRADEDLVLPIATGHPALNPDRTAWRFADTVDGAPLWTAATYGLGTVHILLLDADALRIPRIAMWRALLWLPAPDADDLGASAALTDALDARLATEGCAHAKTHVSTMENATRRYLEDIPGVAPLPMSWLLIFSALYLLTIGPLDYLVLKRLGRQPLTWVTFPITIALFSSIALIGTTWTKGTRATVTRVEIVDVLPGTDLWRGRSHLGVFATRKTDLRLTAGFPDGVIAPQEEGGFLSNNQVVSSEGPGALAYRAETWTLAFVETAWIAPAAGSVTLTLDETNASLSSTLPFDLDEVWLGHQDRWAALTTGPDGLRAGETHTIERTQLTPDATGANKTPLPDWPLGGCLELRESTGGHLHPQDHDWILVATTQEPIEPIVLEGLSPDHRSITLIRIPLSPRTTPTSETP